MAFLTDIADDFDVVDGIEDVSYQRRDASGTTTTTYTGVDAWKTATKAEAISTAQGGKTTVYSCRWRLKPETLAVEPRRGDRIVSTTYGTWEILRRDTDCIGTEYVCHCQKVS